jgi:hypothetical protein
MAVTMYNAVREFMSRRYPKKGKKGIGNKNRSHNPPIKRRNFHLSLSLVYNMLIIQFCMDLREIELLKKKLGRNCYSSFHRSWMIQTMVF